MSRSCSSNKEIEKRGILFGKQVTRPGHLGVVGGSYSNGSCISTARGCGLT
jgi:hypothetical protein